MPPRKRARQEDSYITDFIYEVIVDNEPVVQTLAAACDSVGKKGTAPSLVRIALFIQKAVERFVLNSNYPSLVDHLPAIFSSGALAISYQKQWYDLLCLSHCFKSSDMTAEIVRSELLAVGYEYLLLHMSPPTLRTFHAALRAPVRVGCGNDPIIEGCLDLLVPPHPTIAKYRAENLMTVEQPRPFGAVAPEMDVEYDSPSSGSTPQRSE